MAEWICPGKGVRLCGAARILAKLLRGRSGRAVLAAGPRIFEECMPRLAELEPHSDDADAELVESLPPWARTRPTGGSLDQIPHDLGTNLLGRDQAWDMTCSIDVGPVAATFGKTSTEFGPSSTEVRPTDVEPIWAEFRRFCPKKAPAVDQIGATSRQSANVCAHMSNQVPRKRESPNSCWEGFAMVLKQARGPHRESCRGHCGGEQFGEHSSGHSPSSRRPLQE